MNKMIINTHNLVKNFNALPTNNICAMVKANAYGHNLKIICKALRGRARFFGVANLTEAMQIRLFDAVTPIIIVGLITDYATAINNNISITIDNETQLQKILKITTKNKAKIHIKINTGMNRLGVKNAQQFQKLIKIIEKNQKKLEFEGVFTHFSTCECDKSYFYWQFDNFKKFIKIIPKYYNPIIHIGGSGVIKYLTKNELNLYMIRTGISLYTQPNPVMKITSKIIKISELKSGERLGYSNGFIAEKPTKIAIIPLGYYDGINRKLSNNGYIKINNKRCKIIGNICMDMMFVDVTNINCDIGNKVIIFDNADNWAAACKTINYEILTSIKSDRMTIIKK